MPANTPVSQTFAPLSRAMILIDEDREIGQYPRISTPNSCGSVPEKNRFAPSFHAGAQILSAKSRASFALASTTGFAQWPDCQAAMTIASGDVRKIFSLGVTSVVLLNDDAEASCLSATIASTLNPVKVSFTEATSAFAPGTRSQDDELLTRELAKTFCLSPGNVRR